MTSLLDGGFCVHLLFGVTGSGKTEVYLQIAENVLQTGKNVLILVPEISLISQMERRFRARFGDCVAIYHSGLSAGERYDQWVQVLEKRKTIMVGTRSAVFMPFTDLGMIIVDEEHDGSYKQESGLRYNARDVAAVRGKFADVPVLLGSATPSVQSYHNVKTGKYGRLLLNQRIDERPLARVVVEDLKELEHEKGIRRFLSPRLIKAIRDNLDRKEQTLIFINRRGYASFALCVICGEPVRCNHCDICLTVHLKDKSLICHYCGFMKPVKSTCAVCGSSNIVHMGLGTEKVEEMMRNLFPGARVQRMDRDTTRKKNSVLSVLKGLREKSIDILVGTQMVAKGHDFPNITLVGIICADFSLNFPDFRAGERTFQLLAQVAGRAGRGDLPGKVILQTFNPRHFSIETAKNQDYGSFYEKEIGFRSMLGYPPYSRLALLRFTGKNRKQTMETAKMVTEKLQAALQSDNDLKQNIALLGPVESPVAKIAGQYRWQLLIKADSSARRNRFIKSFWKKNDTLMKNKHVRMVLDIDPYNV
jgi:primosomal protein N' (replication factor Y)